MWWILAGVVLVALVLLFACLAALAGRVRPLRRAMRRLMVRADQAQRLQRRGETLRTSVAGVQTKLQEAVGRAEQLRP
jgi:hypothetical protein